MCSHLRAPRSRRWPLLSLWCTVQAAEGVLHNLSTPCQPRPLIYEREGCFVNAGECVGRVHKRNLKIATTRFSQCQSWT